MYTDLMLDMHVYTCTHTDRSSRDTMCDVLPSGFTKYNKNDSKLTLISTIYTELTAQK